MFLPCFEFHYHVFTEPTVIQRISSIAHCSEMNANKKTRQILRMISGVCETNLINLVLCKFCWHILGNTSAKSSKILRFCLLLYSKKYVYWSFIVSFKNKLMHNEEISFFGELRLNKYCDIRIMKKGS
jgi:hypothetical protein